MNLTVALCTYNPDLGLLSNVLDELVDQTKDLGTSEIIVVDNNSIPPLAQRQHLLEHQVQYIREPRYGLTAARETAIKNASGEIIVFVDDDNILGDSYLKTVLTAFDSDPDLGLLGGRVIPHYEVQPPPWFYEFEPWLAIRRHSPEDRVETTAPPYSQYFPVGAGFALRRELAVAYIADCAATTRIEGRRGAELTSGEDTDIGFFVLSRGMKLAVTGRLHVTHVIPAERVESDYLQRLAVAHVTSALALNRKWSRRFRRCVFPELSQPLVVLLAKALAACVLGLASPRYRIKRGLFTTLSRHRVGLLR